LKITKIYVPFNFSLINKYIILLKINNNLTTPQLPHTHHYTTPPPRKTHPTTIHTFCTTQKKQFTTHPYILYTLHHTIQTQHDILTNIHKNKKRTEIKRRKNGRHSRKQKEKISILSHDPLKNSPTYSHSSSFLIIIFI